MSLSKYAFEIHRLCSFKDYREPPSILPLARLGFYRRHDGRVCCYQCAFSIADSEVNGDVIVTHRRISPSCKTATDRDNGNVLMKPLTGDFETKFKPEVWGISQKKRVESNRDQIDRLSGFTEFDCASVSDETPFESVCRSIARRGLAKGIIVMEIDPNQPDFTLLKSETVRLGTFTRWPSNVAVTKDDLAKNGFYYTGISDRVQCAFCFGFLRNWANGDSVVGEHEKHFPNCPFIRGENVGNVPKIDETFEGNYSVMSAERTQSADANDRETSRSFQPVAVDSMNNQLHHSSSQLGTETSDAALVVVGQDEGISEILDHLPPYPLKYPLFADRQTRLRTFMHARGRLPRGQNVDTLVDAGFFHVGPLDNVKCYCCDIGLKNWQNDDDPWIEHARWSPRCAFVREKRGEVFVEETLAANRQRMLERANQNNVQMPSLNVEPVNFSMLGSLSMPPMTADGSLDNDRRPEVGLAEQLLRAPGARVRVDGGNAELGIGEAYLDEEQALEARRQRQLNNQNEIGDENDPEAQHLLAENQQLRQVKTCKVCMDKEVNVVFLPCGHLVCCEECAPNLRTCAICRTYIRGTVKVFLS